jgi:hypothetical protein
MVMLLYTRELDIQITLLCFARGNNLLELFLAAYGKPNYLPVYLGIHVET